MSVFFLMQHKSQFNISSLNITPQKIIMLWGGLVTANVYRVSFCSDENVPELDSRNGYKTPGLY